MNRLKKFWIFAIVLIVAIATSIIVEINRYVPESKAEEKNTKSISVTYKSGIGEGEDYTNFVWFANTGKQWLHRRKNSII